MGNIMAVGTSPVIHFYDLANPLDPQKYELTMDRHLKSGSSTALAKLQNGRYLMVVSATDANPVDFYISNRKGPPEEVFTEAVGFSNIDRWDKDLEYAGTRSHWPAFQSLNLVTECYSGKLFLVGTHQVHKILAGADWISLYEVVGSNEVKLIDRGQLHVNCNAYGDDDYCNFDAAGGVYIAPNHTIAIYATDWENEGPAQSIELKEFWSESVLAPIIFFAYDNGEIGSRLFAQGLQFSPQTAVNIVLNGVTLFNNLQVNDEGEIGFMLNTSTADYGSYTLAITEGSSSTSAGTVGSDDSILAQTSFVLEPGAPLRSDVGEGPEIAIPAGIIILDRQALMPAILGP